jgi:uncharacterized protein YerC
MSKPRLEREMEVPPEIIQELLTDSELRMVKQRLLIAKMLVAGKSIRDVAQRVGVGTDTVMRVSRKLKESKQLLEYFGEQPQQQKSKWSFGTGDLTKD